MSEYAPELKKQLDKLAENNETLHSVMGAASTTDAVLLSEQIRRNAETIADIVFKHGL